MKLKYLLSALLMAFAVNMSATNTNTLKQIASMLTPVDCTVSDIASNAMSAAKVAQTTLDISQKLGDLQSQVSDYTQKGTAKISEKLKMLQLAQSIISGSKSQALSVSKLLSNTRNFSSLIGAVKEPAKKLAAQKSAEYCTKLLGLCNSETKSQIQTATQILKLLKSAK